MSLQSLNDSMASTDGAVVVRLPVRPWADAAWLRQSAMETRVDDSEDRRFSSASGTTVSSSDALPVTSESRWLAPRVHVRDIIRALNFHVLALMRPESLLVSATILPPEYKEEYANRQEHFSAIALLHALIAVRWRESPDSSSFASTTQQQKVVIFTRSSADFYELTQEALLRVARSAVSLAAADTASDASSEAVSSARAALGALDASLRACDYTLLQLRGYASSQSVIDSVDQFFSLSEEPQLRGDPRDTSMHPARRVLVLVADLSVVTPVQLNFTRHVIDSALARMFPGMKPLVAVLAHAPPEQLALGFPCHAVCVGGWAFSFADALGLADTQLPLQLLRREDVGVASEATLTPHAPQALSIPVAPRRWISLAFGLQARVPAEEVSGVSEALWAVSLQPPVSAVLLCRSALSSQRSLVMRSVGLSEAFQLRSMVYPALALYHVASL